MIKIATIGFDQYLNRIKAASKELQAEVAAEIQLAGVQFRDQAKRDLIAQRGDTGGLVNSITTKVDNISEVTVSAEKYYAPFIEFGTKGKYRPIPGTEAIAAQYKGFKRGNIDEFFLAILDWVKRKGLADRKTRGLPTGRVRKAKDADAYDAAFAIMMSILKKGIAPTPFFFKQITPVKARLEKRLETILNGL